MSVSRVADYAANPTIAPNYRVGDWKSLNLSNASPPADWDKAVSIFHDRMNGRFLAQIEALEKHQNPEILEFSGFAIVALDCLLIETLGQFYKGIEQTPNKPKSPKGQPSPHAQHFIDFFLGSRHFSNQFDAMKGKLFYEHFRCGILHQAQTKKKSRIRFDLNIMAEYADAANPDQGLVLDRAKLHKALLDEISDYEGLLKTPQTPADDDKRKNFIKKWTYIVP
jgi:hypothetical protein